MPMPECMKIALRLLREAQNASLETSGKEFARSAKEAPLEPGDEKARKKDWSRVLSEIRDARRRGVL